MKEKIGLALQIDNVQYKVPTSVRGCFPAPEPWVFKNMFVNGVTVVIGVHTCQ